MSPPESPPTEAFWREDPFRFIKPEQFESLGIDPEDLLPGTFAAHKRPSQLPSRFGGNAYGFGFFEVYDRLGPKEIQWLQSITFDHPDEIKKYYKRINAIYKDIGLLIRYSRRGIPYYLIPTQLLSNSLAHLRNKADEISKIINFHRRKYLTETHKIGLLTHADDLLLNDLSIRFPQHQFIILDSIEKLRSLEETLDLVVLARDIYEIILMERFESHNSMSPSIRSLDRYVIYLLGKLYKVLKEEGEIFVIANRHASKTNRTAKITFKTPQEEKSFILFSHIFKTKKRYRMKDRTAQVNVFDFQKYLSGLYVEQEVMERLLGNRDIKDLSLEEINQFPYLNFSLNDELTYDQERTWSRLLSIYFNQIFLKPLIPDSVKADWKTRFVSSDYFPDYMIIYLGQKRSLETTFEDLGNDINESRLSGCQLTFLADYRDSFDYLIRTLNVLREVRSKRYRGLPEVFMDRLREPLEDRKRRHGALNAVLKLMAKARRLQEIESHLNPDSIEGAETRVLKNLEMLTFFGFSREELREIFLIIIGHTAMGRILAGKANEKALKPVSDLARSLALPEALNLLRYCRLMTMAETLASRRADLSQEQLAELFDLYESLVRIVTNREMDWDRLLDEKISLIGGIHNQIIRRILKIMNHFQYLGNWSELEKKGDMEKESLADYDDTKLARIENIIRLVRIIGEFEKRFLREDPLKLPTFYRKFLNTEFHGTGHLFERMDSQLAFILLWIAVNVTRGEVINFNPILADVGPSGMDERVRKVEEESRIINTKYLDLVTLRQLGDQLYTNQAAFILGTGFQLKVNQETQGLDIVYIDMDENIEELKVLTDRCVGRNISTIPVEDFRALERRFANLESFYQHHLRFLSQDDGELSPPSQQKGWFKRAQQLRDYLKSRLTKVIFQPENVHTDLNLLYLYAPSLLHFVLPEFMALKDLRLPGKIYLKSSLIEYALASTRKIQALIRRDRRGLQDVRFLRRLAQREFGPMAAGTVGLNESQTESLENLVQDLSHNAPLYDALIKSFLFRDLGFVPTFREKYRDQINPADHAQAGALFLEKERIPLRYNSDEDALNYLITLVRHHDFLHHIIRGEFSPYAIQEVINFKDKELFDAFFVASLIMFSSMREDLMLEDLAARLFSERTVCHRVIEGETTLEDGLREVYAYKGRLFHALEAYGLKDLQNQLPPAQYLESWKGDESEKDRYIQAGRMVYGMERIFRLQGIRYVEFPDLANLLLKVPLKYIYKKRNFRDLGYMTFEKELFEAHRIYNSLGGLPESVNHFILEHLSTDEVRIFGLENVGIYLTYENFIKLLLIALMGSRNFERGHGPVCLDFLGMAEKIERRYEAINDSLNHISVEKIWGKGNLLSHFFRGKTGLVLKKDESKRMLSIDFVDKINILQKVSYMGTITDVDRLKNYFHYTLRSLRKSPFYTEDYELTLEEVFEERLTEITDLMLDQAKGQMELLEDLNEIHSIYTDLTDRALEIGLTGDQRLRLNDVYELRKDQVRREKLKEIDGFIGKIKDSRVLRDYWDNVKWYLLDNRLFLGKEFENLIAKKFDEAMAGLLP